MSTISFHDLAVGACFRFPTMFEGSRLFPNGNYFKTGAGSYGLHADEPLFPWLDDVAYVVLADGHHFPQKTARAESVTGKVPDLDQRELREADPLSGRAAGELRSGTQTSGESGGRP